MLKVEKLASIGTSIVLSAALSIFLVHDYDNVQAGYVAVYTVLSMWILCILTTAVGLVLTLVRRTRLAGIAIAVGGLVLPCIFFVGLRVSESAGWVSWANQPMQAIGGDVQAGEVVYYNVGITGGQMEKFETAALYRTRADGNGFDFKSGITYFLRLLPSQAHGHYGFAIGISPSMPQNSRTLLRSSLEQSPLVFSVYHDTAPNDVPVP
jgi:hypothetical protein